ncbi:hypothetical protein D9M70_639880 [compost metagenome]
MASSSPATTLMLMTAARYSSDQSDSTASITFACGWCASLARRIAAAAGSQRISTPLAAKMAAISGRKWSATEAATSRPSAALQGLYFWVLALSTMRSAMSNSAVSST